MAHGNHVAAHAYLAGMASEELRSDERLARDADYPVVITALATRRAGVASAPAAGRPVSP